MATPTYQFIYLGQLPDMDTNETNNVTENHAAVLGGKTFGSLTDPAFAQHAGHGQRSGQ